ncbi:MFS transporter [Glaciecola sp. KUL10]|uniref:MFS transporter n=1 Tax=Glaciecola sp. (strain KUL10) TaxID=2161813 RepID=UPI000D839F66|nr:MFS transporter [Glaciecola sp. KUL10]GBL05300.1 sugar transporter [Glaciecola sp. KUL10]
MAINYSSKHPIYFALIVTIGGFVFGFDAAVISGTLRFIATEFALTDAQLGSVVSAPALGVLIALVFTGALCDKIGRKNTLIVIAFLYLVSALGSAFASSYEMLLAARFLGGLAFSSLSLSSMYIGEIAPPKQRGKLVSLNQIMIVIGLSAAYFSNYFLVLLVDSAPSWINPESFEQNVWRWMLGLEIVPCLLWLALLTMIPKSPRWLVSKNRVDEAREALSQLVPKDAIENEIKDIENSLVNETASSKGFIGQLKALGSKRFRLVLLVGFVFAAVQPLTGVNPILFYAPMVFEQTGIGTNAAYAQSLIIGLVSLVFTAIAVALIDKVGRRPLVNIGLVASVFFLSLCVFAFNKATYSIDNQSIERLAVEQPALIKLIDSDLTKQKYDSDIAFKNDMKETLGAEQWRVSESQIITASIDIRAGLVLIGIIGFIAAFHLSIGPIMWVIFSEIVPNQIRSVAIPSFAFFTSLVSFFMQKYFPVFLNSAGATTVFLSYAISGLIGLFLLYWLLPETKGKSLEQIEKIMCNKTK